MGSGVSHQSTRSRETLFAHFALVRFLSCVNERVDLQVGHLGKAFSAHVAQVRFFPGVDQLVPLEVAVETERFAADLACLRQQFLRLAFRWLRFVQTCVVI